MGALSPQAEALIKAAAAFVHDDGPGLIAALKAHRWSDAAWLAATDGLQIAAKAGVPYAGLAAQLVPFVRYAASHPVGPNDPAYHLPEGPQTNNVSTGA